MALTNTPLTLGTDGNDRLVSPGGRTEALAGNDFINGSIGDDEIFGNQGFDTLIGNGGADQLHGGRDNDALDGRDGNDFLFGNLGSDILVGGIGDDQCFGGRGADVLSGLAGADFLSGDLGFDVLEGGFGNDTLVLRDETASASFDYLDDFVPGQDKIALTGGLSFADLDIVLFGASGLNYATVREQFARNSALTAVSDESLVLRVRSTGRVVGLLNHRPTPVASVPVTLTPASLTVADFI